MKNVIFIVVATLASCADPLPTYDADDAPSHLSADLARGELSFRKVCGFSCDTPAIGLNYALCYADVASQTTIDSTGDVIRSDRHGELKELAYRYAERYNKLLEEEIRRRRLGACRNGEDWDRAVGTIREYLLSVNGANHLVVSTPMEPPFVLNEPVSVVLFEEVHDSEELQRTVCEAFVSNNVLRSLRFQVELRQQVANVWRADTLYEFGCGQHAL